MSTGEPRDFDVAVSFAGEDREFVNTVVREVQEAGHQVFYDEDNAVEMWGRDLTEYFGEVYEERARYAVMFISEHYARKPWTNLERRHILARALETQSPYLLPVRLDDTLLPGVRSTIGFLDGCRMGPSGIAGALLQKLGDPAATGQQQSSGRVPRTGHEVALLLGERPAAWEYAYFARCLNEHLETREPIYRDFRIGHARIAETYVNDDQLPEFVTVTRRRVLAIVNTIERLLLGEAQTSAFGEPDTPGNPAMIEHLAQRLTDLYGDLIDWAITLRATVTESDAGSDVLHALAQFNTQPVESYRQFVTDYRDLADTLHDRVMQGEDVRVNFPLVFDIPESVRKDFEDAFIRFQQQ